MFVFVLVYVRIAYVFWTKNSTTSTFQAKWPKSIRIEWVDCNVNRQRMNNQSRKQKEDINSFKVEKQSTVIR